MAKHPDAFLGVYNGVAKHLVRGVLNELGRASELPLFFKDLQVNERTSAKKGAGDARAEATAEATAEAPAEPAVEA